MRYELQRVEGHCGILSMISEYAFLGMAVGRVGRRVSSQSAVLPSFAKRAKMRMYCE